VRVCVHHFAASPIQDPVPPRRCRCLVLDGTDRKDLAHDMVPTGVPWRYRYNFARKPVHSLINHRLELPIGVLGLGKNFPAQTLHLIAPTVELVARDNLHPAISDLLIEAARQVHGGATLLQHAGEFPAPLEHEFRISDDATRYYKSGQRFLYRTLPFWLASLADRAMVLLVPIVVLLLPGLRAVPSLYQWRVSTAGMAR
jgi:hypothetical protein